MLEVINLALPFFGLIFLGFGCGKFKAIPDSGLAWMDFHPLCGVTGLVLSDRGADAAGTTGQSSVHRRHDARDLLCILALVRHRHDDPTRPGSGINHRGTGGRLWQYRLYGTRLGSCDARVRSHGPRRTHLLFRQHPVVFTRAVPDDACGQGKKGASPRTRSTSSSGSCCIL